MTRQEISKLIQSRLDKRHNALWAMDNAKTGKTDFEWQRLIEALTIELAATEFEINALVRLYEHTPQGD